MRCLRTATPVPHSPGFGAVCWDISPSRRASISSEHLPTLNETAVDRKVFITPVFASCDPSKTEITAIVDSQRHSSPKRGQLLKSALERRKSGEDTRLPNLNIETQKDGEGNSTKRSSTMLPGRTERGIKLKHDKLTRLHSHPGVPQSSSSFSRTSSSSSKSFPRLDESDLPRSFFTKINHNAELRHRIQQEELEYDFFSSKAIILERFLNSQQMAKV